MSLGKVMMKHFSRQFGDSFSGFGHQSENLVALVPVLDAISRPGLIISE